MGLVNEETSHEDFSASITVTERDKDETRDPWRFVTLEIYNDGLTPKELRELGKWLVAQGKRLGREYKSNGAPRKRWLTQSST